jgi:hypothetical protein
MSPREGQGVGSPNFRRLEKKLNTLPTLWFTVSFGIAVILMWEPERKEVPLPLDGNNLRYLLYRNCPGTFHAFGGDYDKVP